MTFYWTNQQGGRLMFYHDHAYGITRLNVYVGEAAVTSSMIPRKKPRWRLRPSPVPSPTWRPPTSLI